MAEKLTKDARAVAGSLFGNMVPERGVVTFAMVENRPTERCQAALDELVAAGIISKEPFNRLGGVKYTPLVDCHKHFVWFMRRGNKKELAIRIAEPIPGRAALASQHQDKP